MREVDFVLECDDGITTGNNAMGSAWVKAGDFSGLRAIAVTYSERFALGAVVYDNTDVVPFDYHLAVTSLPTLSS